MRRRPACRRRWYAALHTGSGCPEENGERDAGLGVRTRAVWSKDAVRMRVGLNARADHFILVRPENICSPRGNDEHKKGAAHVSQHQGARPLGDPANDRNRCIGFYWDLVTGGRTAAKTHLSRCLALFGRDADRPRLDRAFQQGQTGAFDDIAFAMEGSHTRDGKKSKPTILSTRHG